jgi:hypothetical protein
MCSFSWPISKLDKYYTFFGDCQALLRTLVIKIEVFGVMVVLAILHHGLILKGGL